MNDAKRIAIVGISSSGKSVLSRKLSKKLNLPLIHMDQLFWKGNWEAVPESEYLARHEEVIKESEWIIEGYIDEKMSSRTKAADVVLYLDYSGTRCAWRVLKRWLKHRKESRPEFPQEALEQLDTSFLWLVFTRGERKDIENSLKNISPKKVIRLKSPNELASFMAKLAS